MSACPAFNRRGFIAASSASAIATLLSDRMAAAAQEVGATTTADQFIPGKDKRLIVHTTKTGEIETPLELLGKHAITPKELLFVRNNQVLPETLSLDPAKGDDWRIELSGLLESPKTIKLPELARLEQREQEIVLQCSGNGRAWFARSVKAEGAQWRNGAMGNVAFKGVPLSAVMEHCGAKRKEMARYLAAEGAQWRNGAMGNVAFKGVPLSAVMEHCGAKRKEMARYLAAEGADKPAKAGDDFEHSIPLDVALERSILALSMNGEPIPKVHGGPVRLITPGYYGTMNIKWVSRLRFESEESKNHHHVGRYRTPLRPIKPGSKFESTLANSEPNWDMRLKSVIFGPLEGAKLAAGQVEVRGVAWNDGQTKIEAVEVSTDGGQSWRRAELTHPDSPYAWHSWKLTLKLPAGEHRIFCRAVDVTGRTQPLDGSIGWNPAGYAWNGADLVNVELA